MLVDVRQQHQSVFERRQYRHGETGDIFPGSARDSVIYSLVKVVRLLLVSAGAKEAMQLDFGAVCFLEARVARVDLKRRVVYPTEALQKRKRLVKVLGRHNKINVSHAAPVRLRVIDRSRRAFQHDNGNVCLVKCGKHTVLRHHEFVPA